jgi:stearoyl-CoA 9-desaturase NADPH oxidoreductase
MSPTLARRPPGRRLLDTIAGPHGIDGYLEQIHPLLATEECRAEVVAIERGTKDSLTMTLRPNHAWQGFEAGQFAQVGVEIDGVRHRRCYSPASVEGRSELEITVKRHPDGLVSNYLADRARPGLVLALSPAEGDFRLPDPRPESTLLIGGGSGITPLMAILRTLLGEGHRGPVALLYYAPDPARMAYREDLERLAAEHPSFRLARSFTRAPGSGELDGHFSPNHLPQVDPCFAEAETFACGPPPLIEAVRGTWSNGLEHRLRIESFVPPDLALLGEPGEGTVRFLDSDLEVPNSGASLLEQAEEAGIAAKFGCRMGICHTCTCRKVAGTHKNLITGEVSSAPEEEIQLCVSAALGDLAIEL